MCAAESVCSGCGCLSPCIRLLSRSGLLAFLGSSSSCPTLSVVGLKLGALVEEGGTLQDPFQPQTLPEASLQFPSLLFLPPSLSLPPPPPGWRARGWDMPITGCASPAASTGRSSPREPGVWVPGDTTSPREAVGLRTLQTPLQPHGEYIGKGLGGVPSKVGAGEAVSWVQGRDQTLRKCGWTPERGGGQGGVYRPRGFCSIGH